MKTATMQCQSYLPLYYTHNDLNVDANGNNRSVYTGHAKPPTGHFNQGLLNFGVTEGYPLGYDKEFMRQMILQQEVTFKGQVQELHRLYRRQRELLDEIKRADSYKKNALSEVQWLPNSLASNVSFSSDQKAAPMFGSGANIATASHVSINMRSSNVLDLSLFQNNIARRKQPLDLQLPADEFINSEGKESLNNFGVPRVSILSTHASNRASPITPLGNTKPFFVSTSPATVSSQTIDLAKFSGSKHTWSGSLNDCPDRKKLKMCKDLIETDYTNASQRWQPCGEDERAGKIKSSLNSSSWYSYSESLQRLAEAGQIHQTAPLFTNKVGRLENGRRYTDGKISGSIHEMLDLNTPGEVGASRVPILEFPAAHQAVPYSSPKYSAIKSQAPCVDVLDYSSSRDIYEKARSLQVSCSESNVKASSTSSCFLFQSYKCDLSSADNVTAKHTNRLDSIDLNCAGVAVLDGISADSINDSREKVDDLTSPELVSSQVFPSSSVAPKEHVPNADQDQTGQNKKCRLFDINLPCHITTDMEWLEDDPVGIDSKQSNLINLNLNVKDDQISSISASSRKVIEVDLEASIIPISPEKKECPRPRGESQENKTETSLSTGEDEESMDELIKIAVDVLVSISSSEAQQNSNESEQCLASSNEMLSWFAGVVCLMEQDVEKCEKLSSSSGIDEFEAMTLKLTETSVEDYWSNTTTPYNEKEMCDVQFSGESSKGRTTKRVRRKNFQREVLPSLASLSRYEASEDIQIIECLMEAAGTPLQMGVKTRKLGRKRRVRGRKKTHVNDGTATPLESRICLLALPQTGVPAIDLKEKGRLRWENMPRQPRGKRCRTVFPSINLSQEGWMKKWGGIGFAQKGKKKIKQVEMLVPQVA